MRLEIKKPMSYDLTYYLGGPMSGLPDFNFPAFDAAMLDLHGLGLTIVSAHQVDHGEHTGTGSAPYEDYIRGDLEVLLHCDALILLDGWCASRGANIELYIANQLKMPVYFYNLASELLVEM